MSLQLCHRLKTRREELGLKQADVAKSAGLHRQNYWQIENGKRNPSPITLSKICSVLLLDSVTLEPISNESRSYSELQIIQGDDLINTTPNENQWILEPFCSKPGLTMLVAKPKIGKSTIALNVAVAVATGTYFGGELYVLKGKVLYIGYEDGRERMKKRLRTITNKPLTDFHYLNPTENNLLALQNGGLEQIERYIIMNPAYDLIFIDPLLNATEGRLNTLSATSALMNRLRTFTEKHRVSVFVVHHEKKDQSQYSIDSGIGSTAISAAADIFIKMDREEQNSIASLYVTGRDVQEQTLKMEIDFQNCQCRLL